MKDKKLEQVELLIQATYRNLEKMRKLLVVLDEESKREGYRMLPGVEGTFDGVHLVAADGTKHEVPANYAAKSRLVFGDRLKMLEEGGKKVFKQIEKVERKRVSGVIAKKEGKWFILSDSGSYKLSDIAAEYNNVALHDKAEVLIPASNMSAPYAALDKVLKEGVPIVVPALVEAKPTAKSQEIRTEKPASTPTAKPRPRRRPSPKATSPKTTNTPEREKVVSLNQAPRPVLPKVELKAESKTEPMPVTETAQDGTVKSILLDDDLR